MLQILPVLGDEERIVVRGIRLAHAGEVADVHVGRGKGHGGRAGLPDRNKPRHRTAARPGARPPGELLQPGVDEHGQRILGLTGAGDALHGRRVGVFHQEDRRLLPVGGRPGAARAGHDGGNLRLVYALRRLGIVPLDAQRADLVFQLDHDDRLLRLIRFPNVAHQAGEGARVGGNGLLTEGGDGKNGLAVTVPRPEKALLIELYPVGRIGRFAVFPQAEPQQHQAHAFAAGLPNQRVHEREVEFALAWLEQLPVDRQDDRVHVQRTQVRPDLLVHILGARGAGIVQLAGEQQHGAAVHRQLPAAVGLFQAGKLFRHILFSSASVVFGAHYSMALRRVSTGEGAP